MSRRLALPIVEGQVRRLAQLERQAKLSDALGVKTRQRGAPTPRQKAKQARIDKILGIDRRRWDVRLCDFMTRIFS